MKKKLFRFSTRSMKKLRNVDKNLSLIMKRAVGDSPYDFAISHGLRTKEYQEKLFNEGKSNTLNSLHLVGRAVDICALDKNNNITWDERVYIEIANHVNESLRFTNCSKFYIRWGGAWNSLLPSDRCAEEMISCYKQFCRQNNKDPFLDFCHYEIIYKK